MFVRFIASAGGAIFSLAVLLTPAFAESDVKPIENDLDVKVTGSIQVPLRQVLVPSAGPGRAVAAGDKWRLSFFERLDADEDRWQASSGKGRNVPRGFHLRGELSGEYEIGQDGTLSLPILGSFDAAGRPEELVRKEIGAAFERLIERPGYVNILSIERRPVQVIGPVKNPGTFRFVEGMTAMHLIASAGGLQAREVEPWQRLEAGREFERLQRAMDKVRRLVARNAVLRAERNADPNIVPEIVSMLGANEAYSMVTEEGWQRNLTIASRVGQERSLRMVAAAAADDLALRQERIADLEMSLRLRRERGDSVNGLYDRKLVSRPFFVQVQSEMADASDRRLLGTIDIQAARQRVAATKLELDKHGMESRIELDRSLTENQQEVLAAVSDGEGSLTAVRMLVRNSNAQAGMGTDLRFEVLRSTKTGPQLIALSPTAPLEPGDLVRVRQE